MDWFTGLLALVTGWLASATHGMARATKQIANLSAEPYLSLAQVLLVARRDPAKEPNSLMVGISSRQCGVVFNPLGTLSEFGRLGEAQLKPTLKGTQP
jgi:hypothetical protein